MFDLNVIFPFGSLARHERESGLGSDFGLVFPPFSTAQETSELERASESRDSYLIINSVELLAFVAARMMRRRVG